MFCRLLMGYLPAPEQAMAELIRSAVPAAPSWCRTSSASGSTSIPPDPALDHDLTAIVTALAESGFDPYVGRKLFHLARTAGLSDITVSIDAYHAIAGQIEPEQRRNWAINSRSPDLRSPPHSATMQRRLPSTGF